MRVRGRRVTLFTVLGLLTMSCMLPGMIPLKSEPEGPMPYMEEDAEKMLETVQGGAANLLELLAPERYTEADLAKPGTWTYTVTVMDDSPTYVIYGWCATDQETLQQNFEHIDVNIYFNDAELGNDVVHIITYTSPENNMPCQAFIVLMSEWPEGNYILEAVATFDEKINDGLADYAAGDYASVYNVTVKK